MGVCLSPRLLAVFLPVVAAAAALYRPVQFPHPHPSLSTAEGGRPVGRLFRAVVGSTLRRTRNLRPM